MTFGKRSRDLNRKQKQKGHDDRMARETNSTTRVERRNKAELCTKRK
jgi:hypothetical protein